MMLVKTTMIWAPIDRSIPSISCDEGRSSLRRGSAVIVEVRAYERTHIAERSRRPSAFSRA
jgi:hypothetical protein